MSDELRRLWAQLFLAVDMTPSEAEVIQLAISSLWYRVSDTTFDGWVETTIINAFRRSGPVPLVQIEFLMRTLCPQTDTTATFLGADALDRSEVTGLRLRRSLERLLAEHKIVRRIGEVYEPVGLLDRLARA